MRLRLALGSVVTLAFVAAGCGGGGRLDAKALSDQSESLRSQAAEGALLAMDAASGRTTRVYIRQQSTDLAGAASQAEITLEAATTDPALEPALNKLAGLAGTIAADLERLSSASPDRQRSLARDLQAAADASKTIGDGLT